MSCAMTRAQLDARLLTLHPCGDAREWLDTVPRPELVRLIRRSCTQTRVPSMVKRTSHSTALAPSSMARRYAATECSGSVSLAPRWAITCGKLTGIPCHIPA
jgi:hypothetical protein